MAATQTKVWTEAELEALPRDSKYELVDGELIQVAPASYEHDGYCDNIYSPMSHYVRSKDLGRVRGGQAGYWMKNGNLRVPDVLFLSRERLARKHQGTFFKGSPDLAVEVLSSSERGAGIESKIEDLLRTETKIVWIVDPRKKSVTVYRLGRDPQIIPETGTLSGEDVIPGFTLAVRTIFDIDDMSE